MHRPQASPRSSLSRARRTACTGLVPLGLVAVHMSACGGGAAPTGAAHSDAAPMYRTVEDAQQGLAKAERDLYAATMHQPAVPTAGNQAQGYGQPSATNTTTTPGGAAMSPPPPPPPAPPAQEAPPTPSPQPKHEAKSEIAKDEDSRNAERASSPCDIACRAYSSMRKAAEALCRLAGDTDARCTDAQKRVNDSAARVAACSCESR